MTPSLTREQREAIETLDRNVVVLAGAGTGKTHVLVQRFVHILAQRPKWPLASVVALTFTNKAAAKMRGDIRGEIERRARENPRDSIWIRRREEMDHLQVSTVHSLCETILRSHALEAGLDPDFQVLDENTANALRAQAVDAVCQALHDDGLPMPDLFRHCTLRDLRGMLGDMLRRRLVLHAVLRKTRCGTRDWMGEWRSLIGEEQRQAWIQYRAMHPEVDAACQWLAGSLEVPAGDRWGEKIGPAQRAARSLERENWAEAIACLGDGGLGSMTGGSVKNWPSKAALEDARIHVKAINQACRYLRDKGLFQPRSEPDDETAASLMMGLMQIREMAEKRFQDLKAGHGGLDFDDLLIRTRDLLAPEKGAPAPRVAAYLRGIHHVLADEHQDTNPIQQQLMDALAPVDRPGSLFVVGDTKQSIYRFRQAQVREFAQLAVKVRDITRRAEIELNLSFRTHRNLIAATNHLFQYVLKPFQGKHRDYEAHPLNLRSERGNPSSAPPVEIHTVQSGKDLDLREQRRAEAQVVANRIHRLLAEKRQVRGMERRSDPSFARDFRLGDAVVLLRSFSELHIFEAVFRQARIPHQSVSQASLQVQPHIRDLVALLKYLDNPLDELSLATALRSPLFGLNDETLYRLVKATQAAHAPLRDFADLPQFETEQDARVEAAGRILTELRGWAHTTSPARLVSRIIERTGYAVTALADPERSRDLRQLEEIRIFEAHARQHSHRSLGEFLHSFQTSGLAWRETEDGLGDAVRIMTIHAAKGLEFPVVFVAQTDRQLMGAGWQLGPRMLDFDPEYGVVCQFRDARKALRKPPSFDAAQYRDQRMEYAETKRLLYVACTRAADLLILTGRRTSIKPRKDTGFAPNWRAEVMHAFELDEDDFQDTGRNVKRFPDFALACFSHEPKTLKEKTLPDAETHRPRPQPIPAHSMAWTVFPGFEETDVSAMERYQPDNPGLQLGNLTHDALMPWELWIRMSDRELETHVERRARRLGMHDPEQVRQTVAFLRALRAAPEAQAITDATVRFQEMPVSLQHAQGTRHRRIDMIYQDARGTWRVLDWKTESVSASTLEKTKKKYLPDLAAYVQAVDRRMGQKPEAWLCFLNPHVLFVRIAPEELRTVSSKADPARPESQ